MNTTQPTKREVDDLATMVLLYGAAASDEEREQIDCTCKILFPDLHDQIVQWRELDKPLHPMLRSTP